ncbi:MAG TPA: hypothetical protein VLC98_03210 [Phnomibacter sp.]|nr:hypothetical protein [Phnomibacter sp.]
MFTHAGVTKTWLTNNGYAADGSIESFINDLFKARPLSFKFTMGITESYSGDDICQTPIWVRPESLCIDAVDHFIQVVGHTVQEKIRAVCHRIVLIDTLGISRQFLCIENGEMEVMELVLDTDK